MLPYCDGYNLLDPGVLKLNGVPADIADRLTRLHRPGRDGKHSVLDEYCHPIPEALGVFSI